LHALFGYCSYFGGSIRLMDIKNCRLLSGKNPIIPVMSYINALTQKKQIMKDNKDKSGVYR